MKLIGEWFRKLDDESGILLQLTSHGFAMHTRLGGRTVTDEGRWSLHGQQLVLESPLSGRTVLQAEVNDDDAVLSLDGCPFVSTARPRRGAVPEKLCGTWGYVKQGPVVGGGFQIARTLVLEPNGRYSFEQDSYNSGQFGLASGATLEHGEWWVEGSALHLSSDDGSSRKFQLDLRNDRQGNALMVLDGKAYVSKYRRPPWPEA